MVRRVVVGTSNKTQVLPGGASWDPITQNQVPVSVSLVYTAEETFPALIGSLSSKDLMP